MTDFEEEFEAVLNVMGGLDGSILGADYAATVNRAINETVESLRECVEKRGAMDVDLLKGFLAEKWHSGTLNIDAAAKGKDGVWSVAPDDNGKVDIQYGDGITTKSAQVKYYKDAVSTAKAISNPKYAEQSKIVPAGQLDGVIEEAKKQASRNAETRPEQAGNYQNTANNADDRLHAGGAQSKPLTEHDAKTMAKDTKAGKFDQAKLGLVSEEFVEWGDILREGGEAALHAAIMAAAISAAPHAWAVIAKAFETGEIELEDLAGRGRAVLLSSANAGFRGGMAAILTASSRTGLLGAGIKNASPQAIGAATTLTINAIHYAFQLQQGHITQQDFALNCMRDAFITSSGLLGAAAGQAALPIPVLGALVGNIVGSMLGGIVYHGAYEIALEACVESGWTFFGLVEQDYTISRERLQSAGCRLLPVKTMSIRKLPISRLPLSQLPIKRLEISSVRRGMIACHTVGYLNNY